MKLVALLFLLPTGSFGFAATKPRVSLSQKFQLQALNTADNHSPESRQPTKLDVVTSVLPWALTGLLFLSAPAFADEEASTAPTPAPTQAMSVTACRKNPAAVTNCVSTRNVKQLDLYAPPWTFETSAEEAAARIKGVVTSDPNLKLVSEKDNLYFEVKAIRNNIFTDSLEILINPVDKVVTFRAEQTGEPSVSDFGTIKKELESIRQRSKFGVMGQTMGAADTMPSQNGPIGQLKAFYGLQSGRGYEDVFEED